MLGYTRDELTGRKWTEISHADELDQNNTLFSYAIEGKLDKYELDKKFVRKDGNILYVNLSVVCQRNDDGSVHHFLTSYVDITERKRYETELIEAKERAEESDRLKTAFLHNISHEIRTPLNSIVGFSSLLNEDERLNPDLRYFTDIMLKSSDLLLAIVNDIIDISSIEAGIIKTTLTDLHVNSLLSDLQGQFSKKAGEKGLNLSVSSMLPEGQDHIITDSSKLRQILINLINNAIKFTEKGDVSFGCRRINNYIQFSVRDSGIGVPDHLKEKIFERFFQAETPSSIFNDGTGLGLAISKSFVEHLGGAIWLESETGKGSEFRFTLPLKQVKQEMVNKEGSSPIELKKQNRLLIAEDDEANFKLLAHLLEDRKLQIEWAENGFEAIEICDRNHGADLIIMDIKMPVMDGYTAARQIRDKYPGLPIVALTAFAFPSDNLKALESGFSDYLIKPFRKEKLFEIINKYLK